jgi:hypothetical protein
MHIFKTDPPEHRTYLVIYVFQLTQIHNFDTFF